MTITSVEKNKRNREMISIYIDGDYSFSIPEEDYLRLGLYEKTDITQEEIDNIKININKRNAKSKAIRYLSLKLLTEMELFVKLQTKGYDEDIINDVIVDLKSMGYINDRIYAQKFVYERLKLKPKSKRMLKIELERKGISEHIADEVLNNIEYDEDIVIERIIRKKFGKYDFDDPIVIRKVYSFLAHRGFSLESIKSIIDRIR